MRTAPSADCPVSSRDIATSETRADTPPIGHVISIAGSEIWGLLDLESGAAIAVGQVVRVRTSPGRAYGVVTALRRDGRRLSEDDRLLVELRLVGEILRRDGGGPDTFQRGVSYLPGLDAPMHVAGRDELEVIYAKPDAPTIRLGTLRQDPTLDAFAITDNLLGKHFAVLGTTGAGKSCTVTVILKAILDANPCGHVVMLDPHNEYARAFGPRAELLNTKTLKLPYWLLSFEELAHLLVSRDSPERAYAETAILRRALLEARRHYGDIDEDPEQISVDTPVPYRLSELARHIREELGAFNKADGAAPYQHLLARIESLAGDKRFAFMFSSFTVSDCMAEVIAQLLRIPTGGKPITILDISGIPGEVVDVVVSVLFRMVFDFAVWSERGTMPPVLLVCEEAHRYVPREQTHGFEPTRQSISRIAKEGRKYGLGLCLVSQRPAELALNSLAQCNTIFALRLGNENDLAFVRHAVPDGSKWLLDALPALNTREAIVIGDGVTVPMHLRFDELAEWERPASVNPPFAAAWQSETGSSDLVRATIERWRRQVRAGEREQAPAPKACEAAADGLELSAPPEAVALETLPAVGSGTPSTTAASCHESGPETPAESETPAEPEGPDHKGPVSHELTIGAGPLEPPPTQEDCRHFASSEPEPEVKAAPEPPSVTDETPTPGRGSSFRRRFGGHFR